MNYVGLLEMLKQAVGLHEEATYPRAPFYALSVPLDHRGSLGLPLVGEEREGTLDIGVVPLVSDLPSFDFH